RNEHPGARSAALCLGSPDVVLSGPGPWRTDASRPTGTTRVPGVARGRRGGLTACGARPAAGTAGHRIHRQSGTPRDLGLYPSAAREPEGGRFVEGETVAIEYRWAHNQVERLPELAADLVRRRVAVIVSSGGPASMAAGAATSSIPLVFLVAEDP